MNPEVGEIWFVRSAASWIDDEYYLITNKHTTRKNIICSMIRLSDGDSIVGYVWDSRLNWVRHF